MFSVRSTFGAIVVLGIVLGCSPVAPTPGTTPANAAVRRSASSTRGDTAGLGLVPAGFGSLKQDDISVKVRLANVLVRATPLDESVIRLLAPDSYRALHELREGHRDAIARTAERMGVHGPSLWYLSYFGVQPDARFTARDVSIISGGRDFRTLEVVPLTQGFGDERVGQREVQSAIYLFDEGIDPYQALTVTIEGTPNMDWSSVIPILERERALVASRSSTKP